MRTLPYGPTAVLVEVDGIGEVLGLAQHLRSTTEAGIVEVVPAARTVLVRHRGDAGAVERALDAWPGDPLPPGGPAGPLVEVPVRYDGADLDEVAAATGLDAAEVVAAHAAPTYTVAFCGFLPGFAYLVGLDTRLRLPRRATPRPRVPAGSVAIAAEYAGVYPTASPGGWHLLGTVDLARVVLWDEERDPPALLPPGAAVRFVPT